MPVCRILPDFKDFPTIQSLQRHPFCPFHRLTPLTAWLRATNLAIAALCADDFSLSLIVPDNWRGHQPLSRWQGDREKYGCAGA